MTGEEVNNQGGIEGLLVDAFQCRIELLQEREVDAGVGIDDELEPPTAADVQPGKPVLGPQDASDGHMSVVQDAIKPLAHRHGFARLAGATDEIHALAQRHLGVEPASPRKACEVRHVELVARTADGLVAQELLEHHCDGRMAGACVLADLGRQERPGRIHQHEREEQARHGALRRGGVGRQALLGDQLDQGGADVRLLQEGGQGQRCSQKAQDHVHPVTTGAKQAAQVQQLRIEPVLRDAAELQDAQHLAGRRRLGHIGERQQDRSEVPHVVHVVADVDPHVLDPAARRPPQGVLELLHRPQSGLGQQCRVERCTFARKVHLRAGGRRHALISTTSPGSKSGFSKSPCQLM